MKYSHNDGVFALVFLMVARLVNELISYKRAARTVKELKE